MTKFVKNVGNPCHRPCEKYLETHIISDGRFLPSKPWFGKTRYSRTEAAYFVRVPAVFARAALTRGPAMLITPHALQRRDFRAPRSARIRRQHRMRRATRAKRIANQ